MKTEKKCTKINNLIRLFVCLYANNGNVKYGDVGVEDYLLLLLFVSFIYNTQVYVTG